MANITVTSTTNDIRVDFGDLASPQNLPIKGTWLKLNVIRISLEFDNEFVKVTTIGEPEWQLSYNGLNGMQVDLVNGVEPTSNADLYTKLIALIE